MSNKLKHDHSTLEGLRILIVDDSSEIRDILAVILKSSGAVVDTAMDGAEAIEKANHVKFDVILMDIVMPGLNGKDTAIQIRVLPYTKKIIALSGVIEAKNIFGELSSPFDAYIMKPVSPVELSHKILGTMSY